ncbi:hypothetical protein [Pseudobacteriovorax antillogorgiicola]|uniref:Intein N-terminal splicing region n=1 Tax=Pseudobacteriovorax antillogorgiicola TaxID=1513793 RepID=A0A1Y6BS97_9BACT|nr:hypothetical protein [Pseudobacteriovorax antillogorgiicola]TCS53132.1 intein [Pseudobacteriovorax antillogorgiicola]SMF25346.1 intein N-terminal splicing region [Pseudobacteriovorax antillogorgiicola]
MSQQGNASVFGLIGILGVTAAYIQANDLHRTTMEAKRLRVEQSNEQAQLSSLSRFSSFFRDKSTNDFVIYPEPYLSPKANLQKIGGESTVQFKSGSFTIQQVSFAKDDNDDFDAILEGKKIQDICESFSCEESSIKPLRFNSSNGFFLESVDVAMERVINGQKKTFHARVPIDPPKPQGLQLEIVTESSADGRKTFSRSDSDPQNEVLTIAAESMSMILTVGGVVVESFIEIQDETSRPIDITFVEGQETIATDRGPQFASSQSFPFDKQDFPTHGATSIKNQGAQMITTPGFTLEDGKQYKIIASVMGVTGQLEDQKVVVQLNNDIPDPTPPPDPNDCTYKCADVSKWYYGPFKGKSGSYATIVPGKFSCMHNNLNQDWIRSGNHPYPIYSFDPANNCAMDGPIGFRNGTGCFASDTLILMADRKYKPITQVKVGDSVWNPVLQKSVAVKRVIVGPESGPMVHIDSPFGTLKVTPDHPFMYHGRLIPASSLSEVVSQQLKTYPAATNLQPSSESSRVWNLRLDGDDTMESHLLVANGVVTGDLKLQEDLEDLPNQEWPNSFEPSVSMSGNYE